MNEDNLSKKLEELKAEIKKNIPEFNLYIKERSKLMRFIGKILFFNKSFMTRFTTTLYPNVYMPREDWENPWSCLPLLSHEYCHLISAKKKGSFLFSFLYGAPQILAPLALLSLLAIPFSNWWLLNLSWLVLAGPLPAYFRMKEELEAYTMTLMVDMILFINHEPSKEVLTKIEEDDIVFIASNFYTGAYYFMWPFKKNIINKVKKQRIKILSGEYDNVYPYSFVKQLLKK